MALAILKGENAYPPNFLYFFLILLFAKFYWGLNELILVSVIILTLSFGAKFYFSFNFFVKHKVEEAERSSYIFISSIATFLLCFCFSLPGLNLFKKGYYYLGQIPPNIWHNSTEMLLIPFVIWLFIELGNLFSNITLRTIVLSTLLIAVNISIKPSYFFCIGILFPLFLFYKYRFSAPFFIGIIPITAGILMVAMQYFLVYELNVGSVYKAEKSSVVLSNPFEVWRIYSSTSIIPFQVISSCLYPILVFSWLKRKKDFYEYFAIFSFIFSLLIFIFLKESGPRGGHGNFLWQAIICNYIMFLVATRNLIYQYFRKRNRFFWISAVVFALHFCSGIYYTFRFLQIRDYY